MRQRSMLVPFALALVAGFGAALVGCSQEPARIVAVEDSSAPKVAALERRLEELEGSRSAAANLRSSESTSVFDRLARLEARLKEMEAGGGAAKPDGATPGAPSGSSAPVASAPVLGTPIGPDDALPEAQVETFKRYLDEVNRRRQEEQRIERFRRELERAKVTLAPAQEEQVVKLQSDYTNKLRELFRGGAGTTDGDRENLRKQRNDLLDEFEKGVQAVVPAADAERIVAALRQRNPGFFSRQGRGAGFGASAGSD